MLAVGAPGFRSNRSKDLIREAMADVDVVTVRDERSREQIERATGVSPRVTACPAFLHQDPEVPSTGRTGVNFRPWFMSDENLDSEDLAFYFDYPENLDFDDARRKYVENAREICNSVDDPVFIPFREKDELFAREYLNVDVLDYELSVARTLQRVSSVDRIVAMRYHSLVFAAICRTPAVALAYEPKVGHLADRLGIQSARPHEQIDLSFSEPSNVDDLEKLAKENFKRF
ncbi:hypothetical protein BBD46_19730 [Natrialba sp. SSL1]|nr:hypothetical protein BBD46_19730 [Natrialba sp. SSL1]